MLIEKRYDWIEYPATDPGDILEWNEAHVGTRMRILSNPTGGEVRNETAYFTASNGTDLAAQDEYWKYIAPRITEWNLQTLDANGKPVDIPPPAQNWEVLLDLPFDMAMWLRQAVHWSHRPKVLTLLQGGAGTTDTTPPTPISRAS